MMNCNRLSNNIQGGNLTVNHDPASEWCYVPGQESARQYSQLIYLRNVLIISNKKAWLRKKFNVFTNFSLVIYF